MKVKLGKLVASEDAFKTLFDTDMKPSLGYELKTVYDAISGHIKNFKEVRQEAFKKHGEASKNEEGVEILTVPKDKFEEFNAELDEVIEKEIEVKVKKVKVSEFEDAGVEKVDPKIFFALDWLIEG